MIVETITSDANTLCEVDDESFIVVKKFNEWDPTVQTNYQSEFAPTNLSNLKENSKDMLHMLYEFNASPSAKLSVGASRCAYNIVVGATGATLISIYAPMRGAQLGYETFGLSGAALGFASGAAGGAILGSTYMLYGTATGLYHMGTCIIEANKLSRSVNAISSRKAAHTSYHLPVDLGLKAISAIARVYDRYYLHSRRLPPTILITNNTSSASSSSSCLVEMATISPSRVVDSSRVISSGRLRQTEDKGPHFDVDETENDLDDNRGDLLHL